MNDLGLGVRVATVALTTLVFSLPSWSVAAGKPYLRPAATGPVYRTPVKVMPPLTAEVYLRAIRQQLGAHGYGPGPVVDSLGNNLRAAIRAYQRDAGLAVDGVASRELLDHLKFALPKVYATRSTPKGETELSNFSEDTEDLVPEIGDRRAHSPDNVILEELNYLAGTTSRERDTRPSTTSGGLVAQAQAQLKRRGYDPGPIDGINGTKTGEAVRQFQRDSGLSVTGVIDHTLLNALTSSASPPNSRVLRYAGGKDGDPNAMADPCDAPTAGQRHCRPSRSFERQFLGENANTGIAVANKGNLGISQSWSEFPAVARAKIRASHIFPELEASLAVARQPGTDLETEPNHLRLRIAMLQQQLVDLRDSQRMIVDRLSRRALHGIETFERTIAITGFDANAFLSNVAHHQTATAQGGPLIPDETVFKVDPIRSLRASINFLDLQIDHWAGLEGVVRSLPLTAPLDQFRITSVFGSREDPISGGKSQHHGIDFAGPMRMPVLSTAPGKITFAGRKHRYGRLVEIDHGHGVHTRYAHLWKILVKVGQEIDHREQIGLLGNSGRSTGPHVHYEVLVNGKPYDPMNFLRAGHNIFKILKD